jgi:hypothetical protein
MSALRIIVGGWLVQNAVTALMLWRGRPTLKDRRFRWVSTRYLRWPMRVTNAAIDATAKSLLIRFLCSKREDDAMESARIEDDHCPHCANRFEIVCVKFRFSRSPTMVVVCPSCAYTANWGNPPCGSAVESAPRLPQALRTNRGSISDSLMSSGQPYATDNWAPAPPASAAEPSSTGRR